MLPFDAEAHVSLRHEHLMDEATQVRRAAHAALQPRLPLAERITRTRRDLGYRLVEAGLRLAVGRPPP